MDKVDLIYQLTLQNNALLRAILAKLTSESDVKDLLINVIANQMGGNG